MELPSSALFEVEYRDLLSKRQREVKGHTLIVILGTLILCGWFLIGLIFVNTSSKFLGVLESSIVAIVIFLEIIPYSILLILDKWVSALKSMFFYDCQTIMFQIDFTEKFSSDMPLIIKLSADLNTVGSAANFLRLKFKEKALFATLVSFILVALSGAIGFANFDQIDILVFSLSCMVFSIQASKILLYAANLVTAIQKVR